MPRSDPGPGYLTLILILTLTLIHCPLLHLILIFKRCTKLYICISRLQVANIKRRSSLFCVLSSTRVRFHSSGDDRQCSWSVLILREVDTDVIVDWGETSPGQFTEDNIRSNRSRSQHIQSIRKWRRLQIPKWDWNPLRPSMRNNYTTLHYTTHYSKSMCKTNPVLGQHKATQQPLKKGND